MFEKLFSNHAVPIDRRFPVWGLSATVAWLVVLIVVSSNIQMMVIGFHISGNHGPLSFEEFKQLVLETQFNGTALSPAAIISSTVSILLLAIVIKLKRGSNLRHYLGFNSVPLREQVSWLLLAGAYLIVMVVVAYILNRPPIADSVVAIYTSAESKLLLILALVVAAPVYEELVFRGFLQTGISRSKLGPMAGIIIPSLIWASIHTQYDLYDMGVIFIMGLLLGAARYKTDSVLLTIGLHALFNALSILEVSIYTAR